MAVPRPLRAPDCGVPVTSPTSPLPSTEGTEDQHLAEKHESSITKPLQDAISPWKVSMKKKKEYELPHFIKDRVDKEDLKNFEPSSDSDIYSSASQEKSDDKNKDEDEERHSSSWQTEDKSDIENLQKSSEVADTDDFPDDPSPPTSSITKSSYVDTDRDSNYFCSDKSVMSSSTVDSLFDPERLYDTESPDLDAPESTPSYCPNLSSTSESESTHSSEHWSSDPPRRVPLKPGGFKGQRYITIRPKDAPKPFRRSKKKKKDSQLAPRKKPEKELKESPVGQFLQKLAEGMTHTGTVEGMMGAAVVNALCNNPSFSRALLTSLHL